MRIRLLFRQFFSSRIFTTLIGLGVLALIILPFYRNYRQSHGINQEISDLENEIDHYEKKNQELKKMVDYLKSDQFAEEQARLNMGMKKPGEEVVVIKDLPSAETAPSQTEEAKPSGANQVFNIPGLEKPNPEKGESNIQKWADYFFAGSLSASGKTIKQ